MRQAIEVTQCVYWKAHWSAQVAAIRELLVRYVPQRIRAGRSAPKCMFINNCTRFIALTSDDTLQYRQLRG